MRRSLLLRIGMTALVAILLASVAGVAGAAGTARAVRGSDASAGVAPRAALSDFSCHRALNPANRAMSVRAVMRPVAGTDQLTLRIDLLQRLPGQIGWAPVTHAGDLGRWLSPRDPTLGQQPGDVWQLVKTVSDLAAPAHYEFVVTFRWLGTGGTVLQSVVQDSPSCAQRELRPDLLVRTVSLKAVPGHPHQQRYTAVIANRGATAAGRFSVLFTPGDGGASQTRLVRRLGAHRAVTETFVGPACDAADPPTIVADPTDQVDDYDRANNTFTVNCPPDTGGGPSPVPAS